MSQGNVPISLLLDGGQQNNVNPTQNPSINPNVPGSLGVNTSTNPNQLPVPIQHGQAPNLLSRFQTFVGASGADTHKELRPLHEVIVILEDEKTHTATPEPTRTGKKTQPVAPAQVLEQVKNFQAQFQFTTPNLVPTYAAAPEPKKLAPKAAKPAPTTQLPTIAPSKTSINSLINAEESAPPAVAPPVTAGPEKKKRTYQKADGPNKKAKTEPAKKGLKADVKAETKKGAKGKKKTPEVVLPLVEKPSIHATMTTDKVKSGATAVQLASPAFIETKKLPEGQENEANDSPLSKDKEGQKDKESQKEKEKLAERPIIALDIPLLDPKNPRPGQAEVVVNVLKLAEDKYGWNVIHPNAKSAIDLMDEILDDDDEGDDDEDDDLQVTEDKQTSLKKKEELTEEQRAKQHETKMNRKVGKYDYEDPFIDDEELQWEEEITTTKEGFFVYWGPLVEDKSTSATKKNTTKGKK